MKSIRVIGLAGGSCTGKSTVARALSDCLGEAVVLSLDAYYRDASGVADSKLDVDTPGALELPLIVSHLTALRSGRTIQQPIYDFATHARTCRTRRIAAAPWIIVEGLYTLYWTDVRAMLDVSILLRIDPDVALARRLDRDEAERGYSRERTRRLMVEKVNPRRKIYVDPTEKYADLIVDGQCPVDDLIRRIRAVVERRAGSDE